MYQDTPTYALCESIDHIESESELSKRALSDIVCQDMVPFWATVQYESEKTLKPNYQLAETLLCSVLDEAHGFLSYVNFVRDKKLEHHNASTQHSAKAAVYLVKAFMSTREIPYDEKSYDITFLCSRIRFFCSEDPVVEQLRVLDELTIRQHICSDQPLLDPIEPINQTSTRMREVFSLLPTLATEIFDERTTSDETIKLISITVSNVQGYANNLTNCVFQEIVQQALNKISEYLS